MIIGFGILAKVVAPIHLFESALPDGRYVDAALKALMALFLSITWLFIWDKQVRVYFYRNSR